MSECSKCGGEIIMGEAYVNVNIATPTPATGMMMSPMTGMNLGNIGMMREESVRWREKTGEKKGLIFKSDQVRTLVLKGLRCLECGYIEFYAR